MATRRLDADLLARMAKKLKKDPDLVRKAISMRASRGSVASEVAQIRWARELGIGTGAALRRLDPHLQQQIASASSSAKASNGARARVTSAHELGAPRRTSPIQAAIDLLLSDEEL